MFIACFTSPKCSNISYYFTDFRVFDLKCNLHTYLEKEKIRINLHNIAILFGIFIYWKT